MNSSSLAYEIHELSQRLVRYSTSARSHADASVFYEMRRWIRRLERALEVLENFLMQQQSNHNEDLMNTDDGFTRALQEDLMTLVLHLKMDTGENSENNNSYVMILVVACRILTKHGRFSAQDIDALVDRVALLLQETAYNNTVCKSFLEVLNRALLSSEEQPLSTLGPVETLRLMQVVVPLALDTLRKESQEASQGQKQPDRATAWVGLRVFTNYILERVADLLVFSQAESLDAWLQHQLIMAANQQERSYSSPMVLRQDVDAICDLLSAYIMELVEYALDALDAVHATTANMVVSPDHGADWVQGILRHVSLATNSACLFADAITIRHNSIASLWTAHATFCATVQECHDPREEDCTRRMATESLVASANTVWKVSQQGSISVNCDKALAMTVMHALEFPDLLGELQAWIDTMPEKDSLRHVLQAAALSQLLLQPSTAEPGLLQKALSSEAHMDDPWRSLLIRTVHERQPQAHEQGAVVPPQQVQGD